MDEFKPVGGFSDPEHDLDLIDLTVEQRVQRIEQMLKDPTKLPGELQGWIVTFLEGSGVQLPISQIVGAVTIFPGLIAPTCVVPAGLTGSRKWWAAGLLCNGTTLVRTKWPQLFQAISTRYNTGGEAGTDFRIPNFRGRRLTDRQGRHELHDGRVGRRRDQPHPLGREMPLTPIPGRRTPTGSRAAPRCTPRWEACSSIRRELRTRPPS